MENHRKSVLQDKRTLTQPQSQPPPPDYSNGATAQSAVVIAAIPRPKITVRSSLSEVFKVSSDSNEFVINDMTITKMKLDTKNVTVAPNTKVTLFSGTNLQGTSMTVSDSSKVGDVYNFPFQSMKIEKIKSTDHVIRTKQYIGRSNWSHDEYFDGSIGDFRIFDEVLSTSQISEIYNNPMDPYNK